MSLTPSKDPRLELDAAEAELRRRLDEACASDSGDVSEETTGELMRLEETLIAAARAAEHAISLRRAAPASPDGALPEELAGADSGHERGGGATESVREFTTRDARRWRVWMVVPEHMGRRVDAEKYLGEFQAGWLAFESFDGALRRRLPHFPAEWNELDDDGLELLLAQAVVAPTRKLKLPEAGVELPPRSGSQPSR